MTLGARVKAARLLRGYNQKELAKRAGVTQPAISFIENGESHNTIHLIAIADALNVSVDWLHKGIGQMEKSRPVEKRGSSFLIEVDSEELQFIMRLRDASPIRRNLALAALDPPPKFGKNDIPATNGG